MVQGFRASHAAVVALLSVVTALSMLYCHSESSCVHDRALLSSAQVAVVAYTNLCYLVQTGTEPGVSPVKDALRLSLRVSF